MEHSELIADLSKKHLHHLKYERNRSRRFGIIFILFSLFCVFGIIVGAPQLWTLPLFCFPFFGGKGIFEILRSKTLSSMEIYENGILLPEIISHLKLLKREREFIQFADIEEIFLNKNPNIQYITIRMKNGFENWILKKFFDVETFENIVSDKLKITDETYKITIRRFWIK